MECQGCGHNFPNTLSCCPKCRRSSPKRGQRFSDSRLIEFPRRARTQARTEPVEPHLPAWRVELNERVRAIKAKRTGPEPEITAAEPEHISQERRIRADAPIAARPTETRAPSQTPYSRESRTTGGEAYNQTGDSSFARNHAARKETNTIVQAALTRVRRATENANRASLQKIDPARTAQPSPKTALAMDREATARALEPAADLAPRATIFTPPLPELADDLTAVPAIEDHTEARRATVHSNLEVETTAPQKITSPLMAELPDAVDVQPIDEIEPLDYLEAEIRKVDRALGLEFDRSESPSLGAHVAIGIIDLFSIAVSCSPFLALVIISNGSLSTGANRTAAVLIVLLVSFLYLALTQCLCGKTFGMMLTNTRVVDINTFGPLSPPRSLLRTAGYFVAAAPFMIGLLWAAFSRKHRGWHDYVSGSQVSRDF
jgi:uncharacterized RDD family membrane protein YckC